MIWLNNQISNSMTTTPQPAGTIGVIRRFPVKGMAGEELDEAFVAVSGLVGDRVYAFLDPHGHPDFPWMTPRTWPGMLLLKPRFVSPPSVSELRPAAKSFRVEVKMPDGSVHDAADPALKTFLEAKFGRSIEFRFSERSMHDTGTISIFGRRTVDALSKETGITLDPRRFRPNFLVDWKSMEPYYENSLVGRTLRIGEDLTLVLVRKNMRCIVITLDPDTAEPSPVVLETVARKHESCSGIYGSVIREGIVRRGDPVFVD
jgi:hypothetical protein